MTARRTGMNAVSRSSADNHTKQYATSQLDELVGVASEPTGPGQRQETEGRSSRIEFDDRVMAGCAPSGRTRTVSGLLRVCRRWPWATGGSSHGHHTVSTGWPAVPDSGTASAAKSCRSAAALEPAGAL